MRSACPSTRWTALAAIVVACGGEPTRAHVAPAPMQVAVAPASSASAAAIAPEPSAEPAPPADAAVDDAPPAIDRPGSDVAVVQRQLVPRARSCYNTILSHVPDGGVAPHGKIVVDLDIADDGALKSLKVSAPPALKELADCIERRAKTMTFDAGEARKLSLPMTFVHQD